MFCEGGQCGWTENSTEVYDMHCRDIYVISDCEISQSENPVLLSNIILTNVNVGIKK